MGPTVQQIVKRLCAIEGQIGVQQPVFVWLEPNDDLERRKAELHAIGKLKPGQRVYFLGWKTSPANEPSKTRQAD